MDDELIALAERGNALAAALLIESAKSESEKQRLRLRFKGGGRARSSGNLWVNEQRARLLLRTFTRPVLRHLVRWDVEGLVVRVVHGPDKGQYAFSTSVVKAMKQLGSMPRTDDQAETYAMRLVTISRRLRAGDRTRLRGTDAGREVVNKWQTFVTKNTSNAALIALTMGEMIEIAMTRKRR